MFEINVTIQCPDLLRAAGAFASAFKGGAVLEAPVPAPAAVPAAPIPAPGPVPAAPAPAAAPPVPGPVPGPVPVASTPSFTLDDLATAGAMLAQQGLIVQLQQLLAKYQVQTINDLRPELYGAFATDLRGLGAKI